MKKIIIGVIIAIIVIMVIVFFAVKGMVSNKPAVTDVTPTPTVAFPTVSSSVEVSLASNNGNKSLSLDIKGIPSDTQSVEYEMTYVTGAGIPRGVLGKITLKGGESEVKRDDIVLGTCSSGKCVYDTGVTSIDLSLKFNSSNGISVFQKTYSL
ncbi:hypothetical protein M1271_04255 [Patescibacteria group bacterium]|nr:hypothetical protein [Patescibacteria group bacterium]